jgi:hypothetical protein
MSSFLEPGSSYAPSASDKASSTRLKSKTILVVNGKKLTAPCWAYCRAPTPEDRNQNHAYCTVCDETEDVEDSEDKPYGTIVSTNMIHHLSHHHKIVIPTTRSKTQLTVNEQLKNLWDQAPDDEIQDFSTEVLAAQLNIGVITEALITLIVVRNLSFAIVEWPEFHTFCQVLNRACEGFITTAHSGVYNKVKEAWVRHKGTVRAVVQGAISQIHIAVDIWTSPNHWLLVAIVAHFTSSDLKRQKALLALKKVPGHSGEDQFSVLRPVLEEYGIAQKIGAVISDNAPSNNVLCRAIESWQVATYGRDWSASMWRIACLGHIINLIVQAFLFSDIVSQEELESYDGQDADGELSEQEAIRVKFRLLGPLGKAHNIVVHIRSSTARLEEFVGYAGRQIPMDNRTRWNSWFSMLVVLLNLKPAVDQYCEAYEEELEDDLLSYSDWKRLRLIKDFLAPFQRTTLRAQGDSRSLDSTLFLMDVCIQHIQETTVRYPLPPPFIITNSL